MTVTKDSAYGSIEQGNDHKQYFYANGQRVTLQRRDDIVAVIFDTDTSSDQIEAAISASAKIELADEFAEMHGGNLRFYRAVGGSMDARNVARLVAAAPGVRKIGIVYTNHQQRPLVLIDELICKFKAGLSAAAIEAINTRFGLETAMALAFSDNAYVLRITTGAGQSVLRLANILVEQDYAEYAYPNFIEPTGYRVTAARIEPATVYSEPRHAVNPPGHQSNPERHHYALGEPGPSCQLLPIKVGDTSSQVLIAVGIASAADQGADVIACSLEPIRAWIETDALREAIHYATTYGRNGRGCVYFETDINRRTQATDEIVIRTTTPGNSSDSRAVLCAANVTQLMTDIARGVLAVNPALSWQEVHRLLLDSATSIDAAAFPQAGAAATVLSPTRDHREGYARVNVAQCARRASALATRDLYIRNTLLDLGLAPQPSYGFWDSPDIWVRNADDSGTVHQNTLHGHDNWIHARVSNRGTQDALPCRVRFFITTYTGTQFRYPYDFRRDTPGSPGGLRPAAQFPSPGTYLIGEQRINSVPAGGSAITRVRWDAALIPPTTDWHPCLLVEVSPHDGRMPTGQFVWENNNLAQKNVTINHARRGELLQMPFRFGHATLVDSHVLLSFNKLDQRPDWKLFLDMQDIHLTEAIAKGAGVHLPDGTMSPDNPFIRHGMITSGSLLSLYQMNPCRNAIGIPTIQPTTIDQSFGATFLADARMSLACAGRRSDNLGLMFGFGDGAPGGVSNRSGGSYTSTYSQPEGLPGADNRSALPPRPHQPSEPAFSVVMLTDSQVLALDSSRSVVEVVVPTSKGGVHDALLKVRVPDSAKVGEMLVFDVAQCDVEGRLVGGVRLQVNVID